MDFSVQCPPLTSPGLARITSFPRHGAATMRIMCGVFGHMGRETVGYNQKLIMGSTRIR
jgi:hypothetical protein